MHSHKKHLIIKPVLFGILGGMALLSIYFGILTLANSFEHAIDQFIEMWYWISILVVGFSTQIGLFTYIRGFSKIKSMAGITTSTVTTGGVSAGSMVACCAHHVTDILPIIGFSAAAMFLGKYQTLFMVIGVLSVFIGMNMMLKIIQKHKLYHEDKGLLKHLMKINMKKTFHLNIILSIFIFLFTLIKIQ